MSRSRSRSGSRSRSRSASPRRGGAGGDGSRSRSRSPEPKKAADAAAPMEDDADSEREDLEIMEIETAAAAFVLGRGGSTKRKIERVSETRMDLDERRGTIEIRGTKAQRQKARDYVNFVDQQRKGSVEVDASVRSDITVVAVPEDCCGFVMGRGGNTLRSMEEEWGTLMCFATVDGREQLCIFGRFKNRRGAELKVMSALEHKKPGHCVDKEELLFTKRVENDVEEDGWAVDTKMLHDDDFSYALGAKGSTRRKLAKAAGCIIEYVGRLACMGGYRKERIRAQEYLQWLLDQRVGDVKVDDPKSRDVRLLHNSLILPDLLQLQLKRKHNNPRSSCS